MKYTIIRFSSLGDCILLLPLISRLKATGAEEITVVTKERFVELFACMPGVDRILALGNRGSFRALMRMAGLLRRRDSLLIDAHGSLRSTVLRLLSRSRGPRIRKHQLQKLGLILLKSKPDTPSVVERYLSLAPEMGTAAPPVPEEDPELTLPPGVEEKTRDSLPASEPIYAMAPGARWPAKRWPVEHYAELAQRIIKRFGGKIVLLGDRDDVELAPVIMKFAGKDVLNFIGQTSIPETACILKNSTVLICNDSGLLHLAEAVKTPVLAIFGPTVEQFGYYPRIEGSKVCERQIPCRPCSRNGSRPCPLGTQECLKGIDVDVVEEIFTGMLEGEAERIHRLP